MSEKPQLQEREPRSRKPSGILFNLVVFSLLFVLLLLTTPRLVDFFAPTNDILDTSWAWMLGYGFEHHLQWGKSILFTYGPLGFLENPYFYSDHLLWGMAALAQLVSWIACGLAFFLILPRLLPTSRGFSYIVIPAIMAWVVGASLLDLASRLAFVGLLLLVLSLTERGAVFLSLFFSGFLLALGSLIKSTSLMIALAVVCLYPLLWWYIGTKIWRRISLIPLLSFVIAFLGLWIAAGQTMGDIPGYLRGTWAIARGYTPAMSLSGYLPQTIVAVAILLFFIATVIVVAIKGDKPRLAQSIVLAVMMFWAWKEGFTRHDLAFFGGHALTFFSTALLISVVILALLLRKSYVIALINLSAMYLLALIFPMLGTLPSNYVVSHKSLWPSIHLLGWPSSSSVNEVMNYRNFVSLLTSKRQRSVLAHKQQNALRQEISSYASIQGTVGHKSVNIIPWDLMAVQGFHLRLLASPVIQSYSVYTPYLDHLNAEQIWDGASADDIIYKFQTIDWRYPIFDEPATFRAILNCYRTRYAKGPLTVLSRVACARPGLVLTARTKTRFHQWLKVPSNATYTDLGIRTTLVGGLMDILYKPDHVYILFKLADGSVRGPFRFIYPTGNDGLFTRYYLGSAISLGRLFVGDTSGLQRISAIKLIPAKHSQHFMDFSEDIAVRFLSEIPRHHVSTR